MMARSHLVTGGAGFIGSSIARALVERGESVRILDNFSSGRRENLEGIADRVEVIEGDILDPAALGPVMEGVELVFHQAAIPSVPRSVRAPLASHDANATGTLRVLEAARAAGARRVVYAGSSSAYGDTAVLPKIESMPPMPLSPYAVGKLTGEYYCRVYARVFGLETVILRYFNVFGPRQDPASQYAAVIPRFITAALANLPPTIFGDGTQSRDFCFIDNVVEANLLAGTARGASGHVLNIACGSAIDLNGVLRLLGDLTGRALSAQHEPARSGDIRHSLADISQAKEVIGYQPLVLFPEGLRRTFQWFKERPAC